MCRGFLYLVASKDSVTWAGSLAASQAAFIANGSMPYIADQRFPRPCRDDLPGVAISVAVGTLATPLHKTVLVAYDDVLSVDYFGQRFAGYASVSVKLPLRPACCPPLPQPCPIGCASMRLNASI